MEGVLSREERGGKEMVVNVEFHQLLLSDLTTAYTAILAYFPELFRVRPGPHRNFWGISEACGTSAG